MIFREQEEGCMCTIIMRYDIYSGTIFYATLGRGVRAVVHRAYFDYNKTTLYYMVSEVGCVTFFVVAFVSRFRFSVGLANICHTLLQRGRYGSCACSNEVGVLRFSS